MRRARILMTTFGKASEPAMKRLSLAFVQAGFEVIFTRSQRPEQIVVSAIQESVDHIGITTMPGADIENLARVVELLKKEGASHIKVTAGGHLDEDDLSKVKETGVIEFFPRGTSISELIQWAKDNIKPTGDR